MNISQVIDKANEIPSWTNMDERECLALLASEVKKGQLVVEIGALYGGITAVLAMACHGAEVVSIDNFSWTPEGYPVASAERMASNLAGLGITNVEIIPQDSLEAAKVWIRPIDLLWIDGGHSYEFVHADLINFGRYAGTIALHDYDNPAWPSVRTAVEDFIAGPGKEFYVDKVVGTVVTLRRR